MESNPFWTLLGHLHPIAVHFPVALVPVAAGIWAWTRWPGREAQAPLVGPLVHLAAVTAIASAGLGWIAGAVDDFRGAEAETLELHRWLGVATAVLVTASSIAWRAGRRDRLFGLALLAAAATVVVGSHLGATLVHGTDYLDLRAIGGRTNPAPLPDEGTEVEFVKHVRPLFDRSCMKCHNARKRKGKLRLDKARYAIRSGESGRSIVPGDAEHSELIRRLSLPSDDEDFMPRKGPGMSAEEIKALQRWIDEGAIWPDEIE